MRFRSLLFAVVLLWLTSGASAVAAGFDAGNWKQRQTFAVPEQGILKIAVPDESFDLARGGFADLRVLGPTGHEIPYLLHTDGPSVTSSAEPQSFRVQLQRLTTEVLVETGTHAPLGSISFATSGRAFLKATRIEHSNDGATWEVLREGEPLMQRAGENAGSLSLFRVSAAWLRITLDDERSARIPITGVRLEIAPVAQPAPVSVPVDVLKREEFVGETVLSLKLPARDLPLTAFELTISDPLFSREVTLTQRGFEQGEATADVIGEGTLSRSGAGREQLDLPLSGAPVSREVALRIANGSNAPLSIQRVTAQRRQVWLIFRASEIGDHALLTGHAHAAAPVYDLSAFAATLRAAEPTRTTIGPASPNPGYQQLDPLAGTPLQGVALNTANWKYRKAIISTKPGVQELDLDLEVLAHAAPDFRDLRLVRNGNQVPYLIERTSLIRSVPLSIAPLSDQKRPQVSQWKLNLPLARIPFRQIKLTSLSPLFRRSLQLYETFADARAEMHRRNLANLTQWNRSPQQTDSNLSFDLFATPSRDEVFVETDNGDNPPIELSEAHGTHAVTRLLFASDGAPLALYYGENSVAPPRYDLELIAANLLNEEKSRATLGAEEPADGRAPRSPHPGLPGGALLWVSLTLVVVVLLLVIARLLPKPPPPSS